MKLEYNSKSSKLLKWFYALQDWELPNNSCEYIRRYIWMLIGIIPFTIIAGPAYITSLFGLNRWYHSQKDNMFFGICLYVLPVILFCLGNGFTFFFIDYEKKSFLHFSQFFGFMLICIIIFFSLIYLTIVDTDMYKSKKAKKAKKESKFSKFYKSLKEKYCEKIEYE